MRAGHHRAISIGIGVSVAAFILIAAPSTTVRTAAAVPLVLFLPGYSVLRAVFPSGDLGLQTATISVGLSIATVVIGGVLLNALGTLAPLGWLLFIGAVIFVPLLISMRQAAPTKYKPPMTFPKIDKWQFAAFVAAIFISISAVLVARGGAAQQHEYKFTEFWMVPNSSLGDGNTITLGIRNGESEAVTYDVELLSDGSIVGRTSGISVNRGGSWSEIVPLNGRLVRADRIEAWLFRSDAPEDVYRKVWFSNAGNPTRNTKDHEECVYCFSRNSTRP